MVSTERTITVRERSDGELDYSSSTEVSAELVDWITANVQNKQIEVKNLQIFYRGTIVVPRGRDNTSI